MSTKSFVALPPGIAVDYILNVEVPSMQVKRKMKFGSDRTVREAIQLILRNYPIENLDYLALYLKNTGIWLEETRRLYTYLLSNEDILELKYKKGTGVSTETVTVYHENNQSPEFVKIYPESTVKGLIQSLENKKHFHIDKLSIVFNGKTLNLDDTLASNSICDGTTVEFKDKDIEPSAPSSALPKKPPIPGRPMMGMNPLAPNANMLSELREKRLQKSASIANVKPESGSSEPPSGELRNLLDKRKSASTTNMNKPVFPSPPVNANSTATPVRPPRGPPPSNVETKPVEVKAPEPKPQMPRPPPNRTAPTAPARTNVVQAPTEPTTPAPAPTAPPRRPPPITGRPPVSKEPVAPVAKEPAAPIVKAPAKEPVIEPPKLADIKTMSDADIFSFDDFVDFDQAVQEVKKPTKETGAPTEKSQPISIPSGPPMPAKTVAAVDDFASALDDLDAFDFDITPTPKSASSSSPPKSFTPPKTTLGTSPAATKPLQATPRPVSTFTSPVTVVDSPPRAAPIYTPAPPKTAPPVNNPPPISVPPPTPNTANSSPPPRAAPPPRPAAPTQTNNTNYRKSVRFDAYKQPVAQERGNAAKDLWLQKLQNFEQDYNGTIMFTTTDDATIKDASRKMVDLCNPNKEGNKEVESYLRELDRSELINLVGCLTAALSYHQ